MGPQWVSPNVKQTNKPNLPRKIQEVDPSLKLGQFLVKNENLNLVVKALHGLYEFHRIPESWFEAPRILLPESIDSINQILKEKGVYLEVPLADNDLLIPRIMEMRKIFTFARLPEKLIIKEMLSEPEFDLASSFC